MNMSSGMPNGMQMPEGMEFPDGMQMPEGMELPDGMQLPDGMDMSDFGSMIGDNQGMMPVGSSAVLLGVSVIVLLIGLCIAYKFKR